MRVVVDRELCQNHGICAIAAPVVFEMNADGNLEYDGSPSADQRELVEDAIDACPVQAIFLAE